MDRFWKYKLDHVIFWAATIGFHMFTRIDLLNRAGLEHFVLEIIVRNALLAVLIYFNLLVLIPRFAHRRKMITYAFLLLGSLGLYVICKNAYDVYVNGYVMDDESQKYFFYNSYYNFSIAVFYLAFSIALHLSKEWYFQRALIRKMEVDKLNSELEYLKAQINPHFVFNSINTIYFQIDKDNVSARESLSAFSDMLRYQLYECNGKEILIEKEVSYLKNYVALQRMRKDENYNISFAEGNGLKGFTISPLLLIPFVENAFKHVSHNPAENEVRIRMHRDQDRFVLAVYNTKENKQVNNTFKGIGLKNVKRRLELLYKDRHDLVIEEKPDSFEVNLSIQVS
jgi:two-component system, LytTR family, sensor kinase